MSRFKEGPPEVAPHVVIQELADLAHSYGYSIQYGFTLCYWYDGYEFAITTPRPEIVKDGEA
jgi:hypothetical protein